VIAKFWTSPQSSRLLSLTTVSSRWHPLTPSRYSS